MLIVVVLISLLAAIAVPGFLRMFNAGAEHQAHNAVSALLNSARAHALKTNNYVAVHFQPAGGRTSFAKSDTLYAAILEHRENASTPGTFSFQTPSPLGNFKPVAMPTGVGVGQLTSDYLQHSGGVYTGNYLESKLGYVSGAAGEPDDPNLQEFMTFTIVFSPQGTVVTKVNGGPIVLDTGDSSYFRNSSSGRQWLWTQPDYLQDKLGVRAITIFDRSKVEPRTNWTKRNEYLVDNAPYLPVNNYTGQLFPR